MAGLNLATLNDDSNYPSVGQEVTVVGYGDTNPSDYVSDLSTSLIQVEVSVISNDDCDSSSGTIGGYSDNYNGQISKNMICAKEANKDACQVSLFVDLCLLWELYWHYWTLFNDDGFILTHFSSPLYTCSTKCISRETLADHSSSQEQTTKTYKLA